MARLLPFTFFSRGPGGTSVVLTLLDFSDKEDGFEIQAGPDGISWTRSETAPPQITPQPEDKTGVPVSHTLEDEPANSRRFYRARAFMGMIGSGSEIYSSWAVSGEFYTPPAAGPSGLSGTPSGPGKVTWNWTNAAQAPVNGATRLRWREQGAEQWQSVDLAYGVTSHTVEGLPDGTLYEAEAVHYNANAAPLTDSESPPSNTAMAATPADTSPPTVVALTIPGGGAALNVEYSDACDFDTLSDIFTLAASGGAVTATYLSGRGAAHWSYTLSRTVSGLETLTSDADNGSGGVADLNGNLLEDFTGAAVTNLAAVAWLVKDDFEDPINGREEIWTTFAGSVTYKESPIPGFGTHSAYISSNNSGGYTAFDAPQTGPVSYHGVIYFDTALPTTDANFATIRDASNAVLCALTIGSAGVKLTAGGSASTAASPMTLSPATPYYYWLKYVPGGTCELHVSTSLTKPAGNTSSGAVITKTTAVTAQAARVTIGRGGTGGVVRFDRVRALAGTIGSNPP